jgi:outer membrane protein OmpA-like peptidoglycan-associated protein
MHARLFIVWLIVFALFCDSACYALTPAQKREKQRIKMERKREAQRRKAKRQRIKDGKPLLYVYSFDSKTGEILPGTHVTLQDVHAQPHKKPKINKPTDNKRARVSKGLPFGQYWAVAAKTGYFTSDTVFFMHREDEDTLRLSLYPETRLVFTVTDSLTTRPVVANIIVRNPRRHKVMQTTSDSLHASLAVLLDDRIPFYTIDATAVDYLPFHDTIFDPATFAGVVMMPKEIKSFVLHDIFFATGETTILDSSEPALKELYQFLLARPQQCIRIVGHTDNVGSDRSNQILSEGRCKEVRQAMIERGVNPERMHTEGRGERDPIVPNNSEENRQRNRRVEIVLL